MPAGTGTDKVFDQGLNYVVQNVTHIVLLTGEPANFTDADSLSSNGGTKLSELPISASELSIQNSGSGGREIVIPKKGHLPIESGDITHLALLNRDANELLPYTEHDDGNGNPVSVTADEGYNIKQTTIGYQDFQTA